MPDRPAPIFGPETWAMHADRAWSQWDLWFCVVAALREGGGDPSSVEASLIAELHRPSMISAGTTEAKLSHLADLQARLNAAGLTPAELVGEAVADAKVGAERGRRSPPIWKAAP